MKTEKCRCDGRRFLALCVCLFLASVSMAWGREREFRPIQELRGLTTLRVDVDGLPSPLENTQISEVSLGDAVEASLREFGLTIAADAEAGAATFRVTVLAPKSQDGYFYTIYARLDEPCSPNRAPDLIVPWCVTWAAYPRIGFLAVGAEDALTRTVLQVVAQFGLQWAIENGEDQKR